jgi:rhamnose transport system ATP-binding protein
MPSPTDAPLLQLTGITKSFQAVRALRGVSLALRAGEVHALLGENGAGKSTLIKVISGAHTPDGGTLEVAGEKLEGLTPARAHRLGIACIYQQPALFPDLTVAENIALALEPPKAWRPIGWGARQKRAAELLREVGAAIDPSREVRQLSMPEQQLVEIAKAIGAGARVLIMDEPTASLTSQEVARLLQLVRDLRARGTAIIYITHRLEEIFQVADRVTVLRDGESVASHPISEVTEGELIRLMVGREMAAIYPPALAAPGATVLALRHVGSRAAGVREVSFEVRAGEIFGLAGLVGAGRTELARVLFGITPAETGTIELRGETVTIRSPREAIRHGIAYVPEDRRRHGVILPMSIASNTSMASHAQLFPGGWLRPAAERALAEESIRRFQIKTPGGETPAAALSGGNQQKVALARWLAIQPKVLILDEPTQGVDVGAKAEIHGVIRRLAAEGLAVVLISSDLPEVLGMSDRIGVMRGGTLVETVPAATATAHQVMAAALGQLPAAA